MGKSRTVYTRLLILAVTASIFIISWDVSRAWNDKEQATLQVVVLNVGQGSAIYIKTPDERELLIDTGRDMKSMRAISQFRPFYDRYLDYVLITHGDYDHMAMLPYVIRSFKIGAIGWFSRDSTEGLEKAIGTAIANEATPIKQLHRKDAIVLGPELYVQVLWPPEGYDSSKRNNTSLVFRLVYQDTTFLFPGDIEQEVEQTIVEQTENIQADVLVVAHHGSKSSSLGQFIAQVDPEVAVIQAGKDNPYGHPHAATLETLYKQGVIVLTTAQTGSVSFVSDGQEIVYNTKYE